MFNRKAFSLLLIVVMLAGVAFMSTTARVTASASATAISRSCSHFEATGTSDAPYVIFLATDWVAGWSAAPEDVAFYWMAVPVASDGSFSAVLTFPPFASATKLTYSVWGTDNAAWPNNDAYDVYHHNWDGGDYLQFTEKCEPATAYIPESFVQHTITCDVAVFDMPAGNAIEGALITAGQTWYINPVPVDGADGQPWSQVFVGGALAGYIPTMCVGAVSG